VAILAMKYHLADIEISECFVSATIEVYPLLYILEAAFSWLE
jgi:hypothetical protein